MVPSLSALLRSLQASASSLRTVKFAHTFSSFSSLAAFAVLVSSIIFYLLVVRRLVDARANARETRLEASVQVVHTLAGAGVSREVLAYAISVTGYPSSVNHPEVESLRCRGEVRKALRKLVLANKLERFVYRRMEDAEDAEERELDAEKKVELRKAKLERIVEHEHVLKLWEDVVDELEQLHVSRSSSSARHSSL